MAFRPLHKVRVQRENLDEENYPENHLIWRYFKNPEKMEVTLPARSDYMRGNEAMYNEFFICETPDGMKFVLRKEDVQVVIN